MGLKITYQQNVALCKNNNSGNENKKIELEVH